MEERKRSGWLVAGIAQTHGDFRFCEGFRMTADRDDAACTGAVVRNPPMKETALWERVAVPRALIYGGLTLAAAVICQHNFCVMARTLLMVENSFCIMCISKSYVWQKYPIFQLLRYVPDC
jgi:hypothetical protein